MQWCFLIVKLHAAVAKKVPFKSTGIFIFIAKRLSFEPPFTLFERSILFFDEFFILKKKANTFNLLKGRLK